MSFALFQQTAGALGIDPGTYKRDPNALKSAAEDPRAMHALLAPLFRELVEHYIAPAQAGGDWKGLGALENEMTALVAAKLAVSRGAPGIFRRFCDALELTQEDAPWLLHITLATTLQGVIAHYTNYLAQGGDVPLGTRSTEGDEALEETAMAQALRAMGLGKPRQQQEELVPPEPPSSDEMNADVWESHLSACNRIWRNLALELTLRHGEPSTSRWIEQCLRQTSPQRKQQRIAALALAGKSRTALEKELASASTSGNLDEEDDDPQVAKAGLEFSAILFDMVLELLRRTANPALVLTPNDKRDVRRVRPHDSLIRTLAGVNRGPRFCDPDGPLLQRPRPWSMKGPDAGRTERGGLHHRKLSFYKFPDRNGPIRSFLKVVNGDTAAFSRVFAAVNALQETAWRINPLVWQVQKAILKGCDDPEVVEMREGLDLDDIPLAPSFTGKWKGWLEKTFFARHRPQGRSTAGSLGNKKSKSAGWRLISPLGAREVQRLHAAGSFHFAHNIDSRGRIYPLGSYLQPQGEDTFRALLEFDTERPITKEGVKWLAVHGSQCASTQRIARDLGIEAATLSIEQRLSWVEKVTPLIVESAEEPMECTWWRDTGGRTAFQFLAFCFAWRTYKRDGVLAKCRLPIHVDGTCNGLQHIAALTRDLDLGKAVNLVPGEPADIYLSVTRAVLEKAAVAPRRIVAAPAQETPLELSLHEFEPRLRQLIAKHPGLVDRDAAKKVVMVIPYGATVRSYAKELVSHLKDKITDPAVLRDLSSMGRVAAERIERARAAHTNDTHPGSPLRGKLAKRTARSDEELHLYYGQLLLATLLAREFDLTLGELYPVVGRFKAWLQDSCRRVTREGLPLMWVSPSGLPVLQNGFKTSTTQIDITGVGRIRLSHFTLSDAVDAQAQSRGILPNFIHSLDGAHLVGTVETARARGVRDFSMIHDSFGTHAADMPTLAAALRSAFQDVYAEDRLEELRDFLAAYIAGDAFAVLQDDARSRSKASLVALGTGLREMQAGRRKSAAQLPAYGDLGDLDIAQVATSDYFFY